MSENFATALDSLGTLLPSDPGRDAIHLATYAVTSDERLFPGQHVGIVGGKASMQAPKLIGIVDPFLATGVNPGQMFWLVLYPRTITSLRHVWEHPEFRDERVRPVLPIQTPDDTRREAEQWLQRYADELDETFNDLIRAADAWVESGEWYYGDGMIGSGYNGKFEGTRTHDQFWHYYQAYKGVLIDPDKQESFFTCAC